jgi:plastocyanin
MAGKKDSGYPRLSRRLEGKGPKVRSVGPFSIPMLTFSVALVFFVVGLVVGGVFLGATFAKPASSGAAQTTAAGAVTVAEAGIAFVPANITVSVGTTVTWVNDDPVLHDVTFQAGFGSGGIGSQAPGKSWSYTFTQPGVYLYRCQVHSSDYTHGMVGVVTVK